MGYVAVRGGKGAIRSSETLIGIFRRREGHAALGVPQVREQLRLAVDRVMAEGSLYDSTLAAVALAQVEGDLVEAAFLLRAYRSTPPRLQVTPTLQPGAMRLIRRISAAFKDIPEGQILGPTRDHGQRLLDSDLLGVTGDPPEPPRVRGGDGLGPPERVSGYLRAEGLLPPVAPDPSPPVDITREPVGFPMPRSARLQALARGEEEALLALAYSSMRGFGNIHPTVAELRAGYLGVRVSVPGLDMPVAIGGIPLTEVELIIRSEPEEREGPVQSSRGYGLAFGQCERRAICMAILDRAMQIAVPTAPAEDQEFVIQHVDGIEAQGFTHHWKLPHYVDFQSELDRLRAQRERGARRGDPMNYNFAFLDEQSKRAVRRALLKAVAIPGYQVPFVSRELPISYDWGTGGIQVTSALLGRTDVLKVIDQGADDGVNALNIKRLFARTAGLPTTTRTTEATLIRTRHRIPEERLRANQILALQVPYPEPLRLVEPRETETSRMHAEADYGRMYVALSEDIVRHGEITLPWQYPALVNGRYLFSPSPVPRFDNPKLHQADCLFLFGAGREKRVYAVPPHTAVHSLGLEDHPFRLESLAGRACSRCGSRDTYLEEVIVDAEGGRRHQCSDTAFCARRREDPALPRGWGEIPAAAGTLLWRRACPSGTWRWSTRTA